MALKLCKRNIFLDKTQLEMFLFRANKACYPLSETFSAKKTGFMFSGPNGSNCFKILKNFGVISLKFSSVSIST